MRIHNAGSSFVLTCPCGLRETFHLRRDAQQALGRHGETCGMGFGGSTEGGKGRQEATGGDLTASEGEAGKSHARNSDDDTEAKS